MLCGVSNIGPNSSLNVIIALWMNDNDDDDNDDDDDDDVTDT